MITVYCPKCYEANPEDAKRCNTCGEDLTTRKDEAFVDGLIWALRHPEPTVAPRAARILGRLKEHRAVGPLLELIERSTDLGALEEGAEALGEIADPAAVPALARLAATSYLSVRVRAVEALGRIGDADARLALREATGDTNASVREAALEALRHCSVEESVS